MTEPRDNPKCETCRWWDQIDSFDGEYGKCRRRAPDGHNQSIGYGAKFVIETVRRDWCGDHEPVKKVEAMR